MTGGYLVGLKKIDIDALMAEYPEAFKDEHYTVESGTNVWDSILDGGSHEISKRRLRGFANHEEVSV